MKPSFSPKQEPDPPWWVALIGCVLVGFSGYCYYYFSIFEEEGGTRQINWVLALLYDLGGKGLPTFLLLLMAVFCFKLAFDAYKRSGSWRKG